VEIRVFFMCNSMLGVERWETRHRG
jgi:hypothetical protein